MRIVLAVFLTVVSSHAYGHQAAASNKVPMGWAYGFECCSMKDCKDMPAGEITSTPQGWRVNSTEEVIPYNDKRIKKSQDENFHRCAIAGNFESKRSLCLYVPNFGG